MDKSPKNLSELPPSNDLEFWGEGQRFSHKAIPIAICKTHAKWMKHKGYMANKDGTISCRFCPWGSIVPGYFKIYNEMVIDLRTLTRT